MSEMKLIMERWQRFCLLENEGEFKTDPKDTLALIDAITSERDDEKVKEVGAQIASDAEVAPVLDALEEFFSTLEQEEEERDEKESDEPQLAEAGLQDVGLAVTGLGLDITTKIEDFLNQTPAGRALKKAGPLVLGLALTAFMIQSGDVNRATAKTIAKLVTSSGSQGDLVAGLTDLGGELVDSLAERKKN